jgi:hypothetical protein
MLGHYASTRYILAKAGLANILETDIYEIRFADDGKLLFNASQAATLLLAVCCNAARKLC